MAFQLLFANIVIIQNEKHRTRFVLKQVSVHVTVKIIIYSKCLLFARTQARSRDAAWSDV